jgi:hypothetical protein
MIVSTKPLFKGTEVIPPGRLIGTLFGPEQLEKLIKNGSAKDVPVASPEILAQIKGDYLEGLYDLEAARQEMRLPGLELEAPGKVGRSPTVRFTSEELEAAARLPHIAAGIAASHARAGLGSPAKRDQSAHMLQPPPRISPAES